MPPKKKSHTDAATAPSGSATALEATTSHPSVDSQTGAKAISSNHNNNTAATSNTNGTRSSGHSEMFTEPVAMCDGALSSSSGSGSIHTKAATATMSNIVAFYKTGRFLSPPRTYAELLRCYIEFFIYCDPRTASTANTNPSPPSSTAAPAHSVGSNGSASISSFPLVTPSRPQPPQPSVDCEAQVRTLAFVAIPHRVSAYFDEITLLHTTDAAAAGDQEDGEQLSQEGDKAASTGSRKRTRASSRHADATPSWPPNGVAETAENANTLVHDEATCETMVQRLLDYGATHLRCFDSDSAYLAAKDVEMYVKHYAYLVSGMGLGAAVLKNIEMAGLDFRRQCVPCVETVLRLVRELTEGQRAHMPLAPRVVRLSARLQLSVKAARTLEYLLVCHCGRYTPGAVVEPLRPANIAYHNDLTPQELLSILSESGVLWKQGLAFSDIKLRASFMECKYALPLETIAALSGDQLSEEQLIKLERTALSEVLMEERQPRPTASVSPSRAPAAVTTSTRHAAQKKGRASRSPMPRHGDAKAGTDNEEADIDGGSCDEEGNDGNDDDVDDAETASATESTTLTITEDALEEALDHVDPSILATGDADAIQDAVAQHLSTTSRADKNKTSATTTTAAAAAETGGGGGAAPTTTTTGTSASAPRAEGVADKQEKKEPGTTDGKAASTAAVPATTSAEAKAEGEAARKPQLTLAEINPLAQRYRPTSVAMSSTAAATQTDSTLRDTPYDSDIEYMDAAFRILANIIRIRYAEGDMKDEEDTFTPKNKVEASLRELKGKVRVAAAVHASRLAATLAANTFTPRIEQLARRLKLTEMEKQIMLFMVGNVISHDMLVAVNGRYVMRDGQRLITVGYMLFVLCETLEERVVARRAFYQSAPLIANGVLSLSFETTGRSCFNTDLMDYLVDIDRKIVDDVMGIVAETAEMVPGSQLYFPSVELENVVLPNATRDRVLSTIEHYSLFEQCKKKSGFGDGLGTSKGGLVMLFFGPSGTGKTMLANAVAHHLHKKILLVSISQFRSSSKAESDALKFLFREAKLNDAIIFFDECESLFEDRQSNATVTALLSEFERYDGLIILATNKAHNFDEAMNRRISLMMEFRPPDHQLRLRIWKSHIPKQLALDDDVSLEKLALNYELSGGLIRNAVLAALSQAVAREKNASPTLRMADLDEGARLQLRGFFLAAQRPEGMSEFYVTPKRTLAELVLEAGLARRLETIASTAKSRSTLYTQWGFSEDAQDDCGALYLFQGVSGTGKSLAAEGIAYECGATIRLCNVAELLLREEMHVHAVFEEGRRLGAIIVFDEAQVLFNESPKSLQLSQLIQYHARRYPRPVIVIATTTSRDGAGGRQLFSTTSINSRSSCMLFQAELSFVLPSRQLREQLWRRAFPERVPLAGDVDYAKLSAAAISPKLIRTVAFGVCCTAALLPAAERSVTMAMIEKEVEKAVVRERSSVSASAMFA